MINICKSCGCHFPVAQNESYKTLCRDCFIQSKRNETEQIRAENLALKKRVAELEAEQEFRKDGFNKALFDLLKLQNIALKHELEQLTTQRPMAKPDAIQADTRH